MTTSFVPSLRGMISWTALLSLLLLSATPRHVGCFSPAVTVLPAPRFARQHRPVTTPLHVSISSPHSKADYIVPFEPKPSLVVKKKEEKAADVSEDASSSCVPSYRRLLSLASTTILIWLSEPLLSLVDTTVVGLTQRNAVTQLAALGPATTLFDTLLYMTYFLALATTNLLSKARSEGNVRELQRSTSHVLGVGAVLGLVCSGILVTLGPGLLRLMVGPSAAAAAPELVPLARSYCNIRAIVAPCAVLQMVAQAFCLSTLDTKTPAMAVLAASVINVFGDLALSSRGIRGAALATAAATVASTTILVRAVRKQMMQWRHQEEAQQEVDLAMTSQPKPVPMMSLPDRKHIVNLVKLSGPLFFNMVGKMACYSALTIRCTSFGAVSLAAHTIMMRVFFFYGCFGYSLGQTAQAFLPQALYPKFRKQDFYRILKRLAVLAAVVAATNSAAAAWNVRQLGGIFTKDVGVLAAMQQHAPWLGAALFLHPFIELGEGLVISTRNFQTLIKTYSITMAVQWALLKYWCKSFTGIWQTLALFQGVRLVNYGVWSGIRQWNKMRHRQRCNGAIVHDGVVEVPKSPLPSMEEWVQTNTTGLQLAADLRP